MKYYHACIFTPYEELSGVVDVWEKKSNSLLVVEHPAEGKTQRVHCHFLIETESGENWFRDEAKRVMGEYIKRGNYWIATRVMKGEHAGKVIERESTAIYMLKGKLAEKYAKNFSSQELDTSRQNWVETVKSDNTGEGSERIISEIVKKFNIKKEPRFWRDESEIEFGQCKYNLSLLWDLVRSTTWKFLWGQKRMSPHASHYKIIASSVFMRICEDANCFDHGMAYVMEKWY